MIFVTVGTQLPFFRLIDAMDEIAGGICETVIAQTCKPQVCENLIVEPEMARDRYADVMDRARIIVAHAGIGTIIAARDAAKPLIVVPRQAKFGEHRNDHQIGTARQLVGRDGITCVWDTAKLADLISREFTPPNVRSGPALEGLVSNLRSFIG